MGNTTDWLKDASYEYSSESKTLRVKIPNSATSKEFTFKDKKSRDLVMCLLDTVWQLEKAATARDASKVSRFEIIDHSDGGTGRDFVKYGVKVELSFQDDNRMLKVFLSDQEQKG